MNSRIPGFYKKTLEERRELLDTSFVLTDKEWEALHQEGALSHSRADKMVENAIGTYSLPYGLGLNFQVNGKDYVVPMAIEEPSVIASASHIAKIVRDTGGFKAKASERTMIGQIQVIGCPDVLAARRTLIENQNRLLEVANEAAPGMARRGGGAKKVEVKLLDPVDDSDEVDSLVVHVFIDTCDAMGANTINTMAEACAPIVEELAGGVVNLRILSNYTDECVAEARCVIPPQLLSIDGFSGEQVRDGVVSAYEFALQDVYRAVTHNKGVMNGIDAAVIASGNDWRAIEAAAHAYAARRGRYGPMTAWSVDPDGNLVGELALPMPVGIVGGSIPIQPMAQITQKFMEAESAAELAEVIVSVGLAQNLGALKALATDGIQKGHMKLQARSVAMNAGAEGPIVDRVADELVKAGDFRIDKAKEMMETLQT